MAKRKQSPDLDPSDVFDDIEDDARVRKHKPQFQCKAKTIRLCKLGNESPLLASNENNPELMYIALEDAPTEELAMEFMVMKDNQPIRSLEVIDLPTFEIEEPAVETPQPSPYEYLAAQFEKLPSFMGMGPRSMDVFHR